MSKSIWFTDEQFTQIVEAARQCGFRVSRGRGSQLARFVVAASNNACSGRVRVAPPEVKSKPKVSGKSTRRWLRKPLGSGMSALYKLYEGDNLAVMRGLPSESIDLIYIDPPYFSQRNYGDFDDRWKSMQHYLDFMVERLKEMHRLLKPKGSIYVHLDWHAVHYVKVEMDKIFGVENFINEIIWCYETAGKSKKAYSKKHDTILFYSKSGDVKFNVSSVLIPRKKNHMRSVDGFSEKTDKKSGKVYRYFSTDGKLPHDYWIDIPALNRSDFQRTGYQTQKPSKLMERIILASSNEGDLVADFFCGSGSFIKKAHELGRSCIGVDVSPKALALAHCPTPPAPDGGDSAPSQALSTPDMFSAIEHEPTPAPRR